jgi:predicted phage terminase large subunit-like protein
LLDQVRGHMSFSATLEAIRQVSAKWPEAHRKLVEDKANGTAVIDALKSEIPGLIAVEPEGGKEARAHAVSAFVEAHNVYLPAGAPWVPGFIEEAAAFPNGAHDDQVDAMTQALNYIRGRSLRLTYWEHLNEQQAAREAATRLAPATNCPNCQKTTCLNRRGPLMLCGHCGHHWRIVPAEEPARPRARDLRR